MLDLWVYTYKPCGFIHSSFKWFISSYDYVVQHLCFLYVCQDLNFNLSRQHYSWRFNSRTTYISIQIWSSQPSFKSLVLQSTYFFLLNFSPHGIGTLDSAATSTFPFYFYPFKILFLDRRVAGLNHHSPFYCFIYFPWLSQVDLEVVGSNPHNLTLFFL